MEIIWGEKATRWFVNASEYTAYHSQLGDILKRDMRQGSSLCDLGCGIGLIDFALSDYLRHITCVDTSREALDALQKEAARRGIQNITTCHADAADISGEWDYGLMLFFHGKLSDHFSHYLSLFKDKLFYIVHADPEVTQQDKRPERSKCSSVSVIRQELDQQKITYRLEHHALEYGQPFETYEETIDFVKCYHLCEPGKEDAFLSTRLKPLDRAINGFHYYLPHTKRFGMFIIGRKENAHI